MKTALNIKYLLLIISLITTGCVYDTTNIKTSPTLKTAANYKLIYEKQAYASQKVTFVTGSNLIAIADSSDIFIVNLNNNSIVKNLKTPDSMITLSAATESGKQFILATDTSAQVWDTKNWLLLNQFNAKQLSKLSGISPNDNILYFDGSLWSLDEYKKIRHSGEEINPGSYDFSDDNQYFIKSEHQFGAAIVSINDKNIDISTNRISDLEKVKFRNDNNYYASYDAKFIVEQGGYRAKTLGLFSTKNNDLLYSYELDSRLTCWTIGDNNGVLVNLFNGDIVLLDDKLNITHKWHIDNDHIHSCEKDNNNQVWLGSKKSGLYKADLSSKTLTKILDSKNMITDLEVSSDNKYLGAVEFLTGESIVKVFELK